MLKLKYGSTGISQLTVISKEQVNVLVIWMDANTVKPVFCDLCHERPLVLGDRFPNHVSFLIKMYPQ